MDFQLDGDEHLLAGLRVGFLALDPFFEDIIGFVAVLDAVDSAGHVLFNAIAGILAGVGESGRIGNARERDQMFKFGPEIDLDIYAIITEVGLDTAQREADVDILDTEGVFKNFGHFLGIGRAGNLQLELGDGGVLDNRGTHGHEGADGGNFAIVLGHSIFPFVVYILNIAKIFADYKSIENFYGLAMAKFVLYKQNGDYKFTTEENYASRISNARRIATYKPENGFKDVNIVLDYILRTSSDLKPEDIRVLTENAGESDNTETRYSGLIDQIDTLLWIKHDTGSLSHDQLDQLAELRNQVATYGERAEGWVKECDRALTGQYVTAKLESMMGFYAKFVHSFDCPPILAEAATDMFKEVLVEASQSSTVAEQLRQKVGVNPHETQGVNVFGISGDDNLPQEATVDKEISDAMVSGSFDALGDDITTADPNGFDETAMGLGSSDLETSGNDLNPDDWAAEEPAPEEGTTEEGNEVEAGTEPVAEDNGVGEETNAADAGGDLETLDL